MVLGPWTVRGCSVKGYARAVVLLLSGCVGAASCGDAWALLQSCTVSATPVNFGLYNPLSGTPDIATGTVTVTCTVTLFGLLENWTVALSTGNSGTFSARLMTNGASSLSYNLYTTAAYSNVWGDGSGSTTLVSGSTPLSVGTTITNYTVYGRLPARQDSAAGTYMDTIMVTLNY
jgi:spore coat protein U-like protein